MMNVFVMLMGVFLGRRIGIVRLMLFIAKLMFMTLSMDTS